MQFWREFTSSFLLPGFQKGFLRKGQGAVWAKKGQFASYKEKREKFTESF
jgi:hypothetical protein